MRLVFTDQSHLSAYLEMVEKWKFHEVHFQLQTDFSLQKI